MIEEGARDGHTGAVAAAARLLAAEGRAGMLTLPGDIPLVTPAEIAQLLPAHPPAPSFTIAPSHDERGSNAIACSPPDAVPLRFGENSFYPHLQAAEACGIRPNVLHLPGIALDIDNPEDVVSLYADRCADPGPGRARRRIACRSQEVFADDHRRCLDATPRAGQTPIGAGGAGARRLRRPCGR